MVVDPNPDGGQNRNAAGKSGRVFGPSRKARRSSVRPAVHGQIAAQKDAEWHSNRTEDSRSALKTRIKAALKKKDDRPGKSEAGEKRERGTPAPAEFPAAQEVARLPAGKPRFVPPMKPRLLEAPPTTGEWLYELKFDGIRLIAVKKGDRSMIPE